MVLINAIANQSDDPILNPDSPRFEDSSNPITDAIEQSLSIPGSDSDDTLSGTDEDDAVFAGDGDDIIIGTAGNDFINGEDGFDTLDFSSLNEAVTISPSGFFRENANVQLFNVERVIGAVGQNNTIDGLELGSNPLDALQVDLGNNSFSVGGIVVPNPGSPGQRVITRQLSVGGVDLEIVNFNRVFGSQTNDTIIGDDARNILAGREGDDQISGAGGDDVIRGNAGNDLLNGDRGNDLVIGGGGDDTIRGAIGDDIIRGGGGRDRIIGGGGNDLIEGGSLRDTIRGNSGDDNISGDAGSDAIFGGSGSDLLSGGNGNDRILGGTGDDLIIGGAGNDLLLGEAGSDTFVLETGDGTDTISDFVVGQDLIGLVERDLTFGALDISQSGDSALVEVANTGEVLASLTDVNANELTADSFVTVPLIL